MEEICGKKFADPENPLLVSVRSGARASMPGMMDTILNLGLNDVVVEGLAKFTNNGRFAYDSYRRFYPDVLRCCYGASEVRSLRRSSTQEGRKGRKDGHRTRR